MFLAEVAPKSGLAWIENDLRRFNDERTFRQIGASRSYQTTRRSTPMIPPYRPSGAARPAASSIRW
jgi:hypothetical protein